MKKLSNDSKLMAKSMTNPQSMRQSQLFAKTRREAPKDETAQNAELLIRAGFIQKMNAGVYSYMPLGLRVLNKIENIIREEMNAIGGQEIQMASLQDKTLWEKTNRWDDAVVDNWFKTTLKNGNEVGLGFTHEEPLTNLLRDHIRSFRDLPTYIYQFQTKFRNETRAKSGILRGREFLMKDLYSFSRTDAEHSEFYEKAKVAYTNIFNRAGIGERTFITFASGGSFSKYSNEFQMLTDAGEDIIYYSREKKIAVNKEVYNDEVLAELGLKKEELTEGKAVEVGNIFNLGTKFSSPLELFYADETGKNQPVVMGSYGIGLPRLMGSIVEALSVKNSESDKSSMVWPQSVAPFNVHLIAMTSGKNDTGVSGGVMDEATKLFNELNEEGFEVLFDDRDTRAGEKFSDADLIGIPIRVIIGEKGIAEAKSGGGAMRYEVKDLKTGKTEMFDKEALIAYINKRNV